MKEISNVKYVWMFITEKCNLNCSYCFYKFRNSNKTISAEDIKAVIGSLPDNSKAEFVISGGEPLLEWDVVKNIVANIKKKFPENYLLIQTNGTLLTEDKMEFIRKNKISLEFGLDGLLISNKDKRKGTTKELQAKIEGNIAESRRRGIDISCTMTVHPDNAESMLENMEYLESLGLKIIEITPAAFEEWKDEECKTFKENYLKICSANHKLLVAEYDAISTGAMDMIITADGLILPNWSWLSLPDKEEYAYGRIVNGALEINNEKLKSAKSIKGETYRERSTAFSKTVYNALEMPNAFDNYSKLNDFLKKVNQKVLLKNKKAD